MKKYTFKRIISTLLVVSLILTFMPISTVLAVDEEWEVDLVTEVTMPKEPSEELVEEREQVEFPVEEEISENAIGDSLISATLGPIATRKPHEVVDILPSQLQKMESQSATYSSTTSSSYDDRNLYSINVLQQNMYNPKTSQELAISTENGNVGYSFNIASIPGKNSSVMSLDVEYNSAESVFAHYCTDVTDAMDYYIEPGIDYDADESIGAGWKFSGIKRVNLNRHYTLRDGRVVNSSSYSSEDYEDYSIEDGVVTYLDGTREGFNEHGYLSYVEDKYGNRITYTYQTYTNNLNEEDSKLVSIQDNLNRTIQVDYYDTYIEITRPDATKIRLNQSEITRDMSDVANDRGLDTTSVTAKVVSSITNVTEKSKHCKFWLSNRIFQIHLWIGGCRDNGR